MSEARRPTKIEVVAALADALLREILSDSIDEEYREIQTYLHGPMKRAFMQSLDILVGNKGEYAVLDEKDGLLIKKVLHE